MSKKESKRIDLSQQELDSLERLAKLTSSRTQRGVHHHECDWRALVRDIARGNLIVTPKPDPHLQRLDEALAKLKRQEQARDGGEPYKQISLLEAAQ